MSTSRCALLLIPLAACGPVRNGGADAVDEAGSVYGAASRVTMERHPCFGTCPVYTVEVVADGTVTFTGGRHVDSLGTRTRRIEPRAASALIAALVADGFFELEKSYTYGARACGPYHTDAPRVILAVVAEERTGRVEHDYGCNDAPAVLRRMQERVDSTAGVQRWIGAGADRLP